MERAQELLYFLSEGVTQGRLTKSTQVYLDSPMENLWEEIREKIFKNYALKSIDAVRTKLKQAIFYIERNPETVKSITSFPYIRKSF